MSSRTAGQARRAVLRNFGFALAVVLGGVGIWLIVTSGNSTQRIEVGVLTGLWGLLLGAICGRRMVIAEPADVPAEQPQPTPARTNLAVPETAGLDRAEAAAARRAFAAELHAMLRRELTNAVDNAVVREVGKLRAEIADLRTELMERVNGQLRLQRIETTTLIGSDLDAMRAEVRGLQEARASAALAADIDIDAGNGAGTSMPQALDLPPVQSFAEPPPRPRSELSAAPASQAPVTSAADPFAALPRLTPFTAFPLDPIETPAQPAQARPAAGSRARESAPELERPVRAADPTPARPARRRRRADDPEGQELLARLLAREGARR